MRSVHARPTTRERNAPPRTEGEHRQRRAPSYRRILPNRGVFHATFVEDEKFTFEDELQKRSSMAKPRGRPFKRGAPSPNPRGRPLGARNRSTLAAEALLEGEAEALTRKAIELARDGDLTALRICLDRLLPPRRERPFTFVLPPLKSAEDSVKGMAAITEAAAAGEITLGEASEMARLVQGFIKAIEVYDLDVRVKALEAERPGFSNKLKAEILEYRRSGNG